MRSTGMRYFFARVDVSNRRRQQAAMCAREVVYCRQPKFARRNIETYEEDNDFSFARR